MQQKKGDKFSRNTFDISTSKTKQISIEITFKNNKFTR